MLLLRLNVIVPFLGTLINFVLGIFVLSRDSQNEVNRTFCYMSMALAIFNFKAMMLQFAPSAEIAIDWIRILQPGTVFTFSTFFHFALAITNDHSKIGKKLLKIAYGLSCLLLLITWTNFPIQVVVGVNSVYGGYFPVINQQYNIIFLSIYCGFFLLGLFFLTKRYFYPMDVLEKNRIGLIFIGAFVGSSAGIPNFFLAGQVGQIYPTGYIGSIIFALLMTYAIIKYQLMDVEIAIRQGTIYTLTTALLTGSFLTGLLVFQLMFEEATGYSSKLPTILAIWLVAFLFQPIRIWMQHFIDKTFYRRRIDFQEVISEFSEMIVSIMDREELANSAVAILERTFQAKTVSIMLLHQVGGIETYGVEGITGLDRSSLENVALNSDDPLIEYIKDMKSWVLREALLPQFYPNPGPTEAKVVKSMERIKTEISFPLFWGRGEKLVGILNLGGKRSTAIYNVEEIHLLTILCHEAAVAFENANLYDEAKRHLASAVDALAAVVEAKDSYTFGHCHRVINHAMAIGRKLNLPAEKIEALRLGSSLHDVGKIGINKSILNKPDRLTASEFAVICTHAEIGAGILRPLNLSNDVIDAVKYHHERYDGNGYPYKLKGEQIPLVARIVSVADVYEALTSDRVYRNALSKEVALNIIREQSGTQFDPKVVNIFLSIVD